MQTPTRGVTILQQNSAAATARGAITLTGPGTANTWGAWQQAFAALPFDCVGFYVNALGSAGGQTRPVQLALGVGAASSERTMARWFHPDHNFGGDRQFDFYVPIEAPKGARIAVRGMTSNTNTSNMVALSVMPIPRSPFLARGYSGHEPLNLSSSAALPPIVSAGSRAGSSPEYDGTFIELTSATQHAWRAFSLQEGGDGTLGGSQSTYHCRVWAGPNGSERLVSSPHYLSALDRAQHAAVGFGMPLFPCAIPQGTRVVVEAIINSASVLCRPILHGWY